MSNIDISMLIPARVRAEEMAQAYAEQLKAQCRARIFEVADPLTQTNLAAAVAAGKLGEYEVVIYGQFLDWIGAMRAACHNAAGASAPEPDRTDIWPSLPAPALDLVSRF